MIILETVLATLEHTIEDCTEANELCIIHRDDVETLYKELSERGLIKESILDDGSIRDFDLSNVDKYIIQQ